MKIVVCVKEILDPDIASSVFDVDEAAKEVAPGVAVRRVISPFDAQALELALRIREASGGAEILLVTLGDESAKSILRYGLSLGADAAFLLTDPAFDGADSYATARALVAAIEKIGGADLVLTGRQAADRDAGIVGAGIAEFLGLPLVTLAWNVVVDGSTLVIESGSGGSVEIVEVAMPAVVTVSHEVGSVRHASLKETMKAARKPQTLWSAADLGLGPDDTGARGARVVVERLYIPRTDVVCEFVPGATPDEMAQGLVDRLAAARLI